MAYPKKLNELYKAEKEAGITFAPSFTAWMKARVAETFKTPILDELVNTFTIPPTSEEIEAEINSKPLTDAEIAAIVDTLKEPEDFIYRTLTPEELAEVSARTTPGFVHAVEGPKKAAKARAIYDEMDAAAKANNVALVRKNIITRFMNELPISKVGASTYLQNIKKAKGLIVHK